MRFNIVQRGIGRAGNHTQRTKRQDEWDTLYGKGMWVTGYDFEDKFYPYEKAVNDLYCESYRSHFNTHPEDAQELSRIAKALYNSHANRTGSVDLQVPAVYTCLKERNLELRGARHIDIGSTKKGTIGHMLSPTNVLFLDGINYMSLEKFWQSPAKCLAIKEPD